MMRMRVKKEKKRLKSLKKRKNSTTASRARQKYCDLRAHRTIVATGEWNERKWGLKKTKRPRPRE